MTKSVNSIVQFTVFLLVAAAAAMLFNGCELINDNGGSDDQTPVTTSGITSVPIVESTTGQGYALAIGLYKVDPAHYDGWEGELFGCEPDAIDMETIAVSQGLNTERLLTAQATREAVLAKLNGYANTLNAGDLLVVSYSGHGGQLPDQNGDEQDGLDETWCLYNGQLLDDELCKAWSKFKSGVHILVFSDSCHSGTVLKMKPRDMTDTPPARRKELDQIWSEKFTPLKMDRLKLVSCPEMRKATVNRPALRKAIKAVPPSARKPVDPAVAKPSPPLNILKERIFVPRAMPWQESQNTYLSNKTFYDNLGNSVPGEDPDQVQASVILISGCQDNQYSSDIGFNGLFTWELKQVWKNGAFTGDHCKFHVDIRDQVKAINPDQVPYFFTTGAGTETFSHQKPYQVECSN